ncbi:MAG: hypothetical protein J6Q41_00880 [Firmicutes bacterium]|nr:hypothetical protein [Bacillota bacterium]
MDNRFFNSIRNKLYGKLISIGKQIGLVEDSEKDLYQAAILLKNLAIVRKDYPVSLDYILEELSKDSGTLKPVFQETMSIYRGGRYDEAFRFFADSVRSRYGKNLAMILSKMDKINPYEIVTQIDVYIGIIREVRTTEAMRQAERRSLVITAFATASVFTLMINFCVVVVFLDTLNNLQFYL